MKNEKNKLINYMKYFDAFAGYGGFSLGIQQAYEDLRRIQQDIPQRQTSQDTADERGMLNSGKPTCIGYSEIDKYAIQVYEKHFNHKNYGNIKKIIAKTLPDFDLLVGGFPCQSFSIAGKRKGFSDKRGTLFFEIARIIKQKQPRLLLLENVKGLLSHDKGNTFTTIISTLDELGYDCQWQVLNSKNFGVPQNRERVFIIGHLRGQGGRQVFPIGEDDKGNNEVNVPKQKTPGSVRNMSKPEDWGRCAVLTPNRLKKRQNGRRMKNDGEPSFTLTGQDIHGVTDGLRIRRLTPTECERLMGLPDNWTAEGTEGKISDTQRYKLCGNGVVIPVVKYIIKKLFL